MISLLDTAGRWVPDWYLVFRDLPDWRSRSPLWRMLRRGFQHVELWRWDRGIWIRIDPCFELIEAHAHETPPEKFVDPSLNPTVLRVQRMVPKGKLREPFFVGPMTCVELAKAFIGVRAPFVRTPYQLYKFLRKS